jgi:hypothetical protein
VWVGNRLLCTMTRLIIKAKPVREHETVNRISLSEWATPSPRSSSRNNLQRIDENTIFLDGGTGNVKACAMPVMINPNSNALVPAPALERAN